MFFISNVILGSSFYIYYSHSFVLFIKHTLYPLHYKQVSDSDYYESVEPSTAPGGSTAVVQQATSHRVSYQNVGANRTNNS